MKVLLLCDNERLLSSYELLLEKSCEVVTCHLTRDDELINIEPFEVIIADFSNRSLLSKLSPLIEAPSDVLFILITPFLIQELTGALDLAQRANLLLTKPFEILKLLKFIENEIGKIQHKSMLERKYSYLIELVEHSPSRIAIFESSGRLFYANTNYLRANNLHNDSIDKVYFNDLPECNITFEEVQSSVSTLGSFEISKEKKGRWFNSHFYAISDEHIIHICEDITLVKERELELQKSAVIFENSAEGILLCDNKNRIISINNAFSMITGYTRDEVVGKSPKILKSGIHDRSFYENMWGNLIRNKRWKGEIWNKRKNGEIYPEWLSISKIESKRFEEEFYIAIFSDISTLKEADQKIHFYANHDSLTGLANRMQFEAQLANSIESCKRNSTKLAVIFIDLDKFKDVNDTYGHNTGDLMLVNISKRLKQSIRAEDLLARLGGDEFVIIAKDVKSYNDVKILAEKLKNTMKDPVVIDKNEFHMTLSMGIAIYPDHGTNSSELVKSADVAMYEVKYSGRANFKLFKDEMTKKVTDKFFIQNELRNALKNDEFVMFYQSVISVPDDKIVGAEALLRWNHPQKGLLSPNEFLGHIAEGSMEREIGYLIIQKVLHDLRAINQRIGHSPFRVSINISATHLFDAQFTYKLVTLCRDFQIQNDQIELEILETQIINNPFIAQEKFDELHALGFHIALDDFGTGYSSLNYLKSFKVDKLKIDQSFIRDMMHNEEDNAITLAVINLARIFKMKVQAEGVESEEIYRQIKHYSCDYSQGYHHSKPKPLHEFLELLR